MGTPYNYWMKFRRVLRQAISEGILTENPAQNIIVRRKTNQIKKNVEHLETNLQKGDFTVDLFKQYKKPLGSFRYLLLLQGQKLVVPLTVNKLLDLGRFSWLSLVIPPYKLSRKLKLDWALKS